MKKGRGGKEGKGVSLALALALDRERGGRNFRFQITYCIVSLSRPAGPAPFSLVRSGGGENRRKEKEEKKEEINLKRVRKINRGTVDRRVNDGTLDTN